MHMFEKSQWPPPIRPHRCLGVACVSQGLVLAWGGETQRILDSQGLTNCSCCRMRKTLRVELTISSVLRMRERLAKQTAIQWLAHILSPWT